MMTTARLFSDPAPTPPSSIVTPLANELSLGGVAPIHPEMFNLWFQELVKALQVGSAVRVPGRVLDEARRTGTFHQGFFTLAG